MAFSKSFPRTIKGSNYPQWEEVSLDAEEEMTIEDQARVKDNHLMAECIDDAMKILGDKGLGVENGEVIQVAVSLFEKRSSHQVFWKERKLKREIRCSV